MAGLPLAIMIHRKADSLSTGRKNRTYLVGAAVGHSWTESAAPTRPAPVSFPILAYGRSSCQGAERRAGCLLQSGVRRHFLTHT
ncbi:protein of unknown function (plasmid) [Cupriavidus taiwanensis]|uniref:Uncharacterized protein n=1 Tax=Cupriavidus taiwanensis TaxID=164546 RepID=A0A9Q7V394_9BURK|nr:protein of unknown function [Cupriavidus taiwanensis]